jgi:hypothetical protein
MTPQRFVDHAGWRRNRRAVRVEDDGLVIEQFFGGEVRVPWVDAIDLYWQGRDAVMVVTPGRVFRFDRRVEGLETLVAAMVDALSAADVSPDDADVRRWLGRDRRAEGMNCREARQARLRLLLVFFVLTVGAALGLWLEPLAGPVCATLVWILTFLEAFSLARPLAGLRTVLDVTPSGVTLRDSEHFCRLSWHDIRQCYRRRNGDLLVSGEGRDDAIVVPNDPRLRDAMQAIERVMMGMTRIVLATAPPPPGALSRARLTGDEPLDDRGLSRVEPEDAP